MDQNFVLKMYMKSEWMPFRGLLYCVVTWKVELEYLLGEEGTEKWTEWQLPWHYRRRTVTWPRGRIVSSTNTSRRRHSDPTIVSWGLSTPLTSTEILEASIIHKPFVSKTTEYPTTKRLTTSTHLDLFWLVITGKTHQVNLLPNTIESCKEVFVVYFFSFSWPWKFSAGFFPTCKNQCMFGEYSTHTDFLQIGEIPDRQKMCWPARIWTVVMATTATPVAKVSSRTGWSLGFAGFPRWADLPPLQPF